MRLFLIRHGESANNFLMQDTGYDHYMRSRHVDPPLTELGERQAARLAEHLAANGHPEARHGQSPTQPNAGYGITHLYCSPMQRALQTTQPVAAALGLQPEVWTDIHEHGGIFYGNPRSGEGLVSRPGMSRSKIQQRFPGYILPDAIGEDGWWRGGYEDMPACYARAMRVARRLLQRAEDNSAQGIEESMALVSHGTFIDSLLKAFFHQIPDRRFLYQHYNTAITGVDFMQDGTLLLRFLNRTQHLPPEMISV
ncbi:MAG: histidine phosphatase family protein [Chloroflexota bacterium]|nr:histidine phosphatase family protein [Chloroflexota bacterium]